MERAVGYERVVGYYAQTDEIRALADKHSVTFSCVIYAYSERDYDQEVFLSREQVGLISALGANIWADVYFLGGDWKPSG